MPAPRNPVPDWPLRWKCDHKRRQYRHRSGVLFALDPDSYPLAWRVILPEGLPAGYVLNVGMMRKLVQEATTLLQGEALGYLLPNSVKPGVNVNMTAAQLADQNDLRRDELTEDVLAKLMAQWKRARTPEA